MRTLNRWPELPYVGEELSGTPLPAGVSELMGWLKALPTARPLVVDQGLATALRSRMHAEELMAILYAAVARHLGSHGSWRGGPSRAELERFSQEKERSMAALKAFGRELGLLLEQRRQEESLFHNSLHHLLSAVCGGTL